MSFNFIGLVCSVEAQEVKHSQIGFVPEQISMLNVSYNNGIWRFGSKVNVSIGFLSKGILTAINAFSRSAGAAKFQEVMLREKDRIHWGLNITNLPLGLANLLDEITFKFETNEKIEYSSFSDEVSSLNVSDFSIPTLNLGFSFDDLQEAGFDLNVSSSLDVSVLKVKGKTSLLLDPITYSSNTITVTGYTAVAPCGFNDLWLADKAGERLLRANVTATQDLSLTTQILPTDNVSLKPRFVVSGYASVGFINVTGTDKDGNAQTEYNIAVSGDGNYSTSLWFKTISTNGLDCNGSYGIAVYQMQWGVVWKQTTNQYALDCRILVGDGGTSTYFTDTNKEVLFNSGVFASTNYDYNIYMRVAGAATITFGVLEDATLKTTSNGCTLLSLDTTYGHCIVSCGWGGKGTINLYNTMVDTLNTVKTVYVGRDYKAGKIYNCIFNHISLYIFTADISNLRFTKCVGDIGVPLLSPLAGSTMAGIAVDTCSSNALYSSGVSATYTDAIIRGAGGLSTLGGAVHSDYAINCISNVWTFTFYTACTFYRQYTFDLKVSYQNDTAYENANVTLYNNVGAVAFTALTNSSGLIATQTVSRGFYNQTGGNTMYDYAPFTLNVTSNYGNYSKVFTLTEKTDWEIALIETSVTSESSFWRILGMFSIVGYLIIGAVMYVLPYKKKNENEG